MSDNIEVIVGTYEQFLLGYKVEQKGDEYSLHQSFAVHSHSASVRTVDTRGKYLASGGSDDRIYVYDMKTRQEIQLLTPHDGIVNHLRFTPDATHLFSASADGALSATRTGSWVSDGFWKAPHGGKPITHISIHPSGKLALTLGADLTLKTWNLIKGRQIFTTNLKSKSSLGRIIEYVEFSPSGENFLLSGAKSVEVWNIEKAGVLKEVPCECKPTTLCWLDDQNFLIGLNNGKILWSNLTNNETVTFEMYESRVKGLYYRDSHLASISSNGDVTVWSITIDTQKITELCTTNIGCRPICLTIINLSNFANDYVLKIEDNSDDDETAQSSQKIKSKKNGNAQIGKVITEFENDDEIVADKKNVKGTSKKNHKNDAVATPTTKSPKLNESLKSTKKRKSVNSSHTAVDISTPSKAKITKANKSKNNSTFIEEDI